MHIRRSRYLRHRFPPEIISHAVWLYHRYCLSFQDVEDLLAERGIIVSYETIRQWCGKFGPDYARRLKRRQGRLGDTPAPMRAVIAALQALRGVAQVSAATIVAELGQVSRFGRLWVSNSEFGR